MSLHISPMKYWYFTILFSEEQRIKNPSYFMVTQLFINNNKLRSLPSDFFLAFPSLQWLDLRNNRLEDIFEPSPFLHSSVSQYKNANHMRLHIRYILRFDKNIYNIIFYTLCCSYKKLLTKLFVLLKSFSSSTRLHYASIH